VFGGCKCRSSPLEESVQHSPYLLAGVEGHFKMGKKRGKGKECNGQKGWE